MRSLNQLTVKQGLGTWRDGRIGGMGPPKPAAHASSTTPPRPSTSLNTSNGNEDPLHLSSEGDEHHHHHHRHASQRVRPRRPNDVLLKMTTRTDKPDPQAGDGACLSPKPASQISRIAHHEKGMDVQVIFRRSQSCALNGRCVGLRGVGIRTAVHKPRHAGWPRPLLQTRPRGVECQGPQSLPTERAR